MLARRTYSSGYIRQNGNNNNSSRRPIARPNTHQTNSNPSRLSTTLNSRPHPIPITRTLTVYPTPGSPPPYSWDTETLVEDEPPVPDPGNFSDPAPPHISDINVRGRVTSLRLRPEHQHLFGVIVYGDGRWVLAPNPGTTAGNGSGSNNSRSFAAQALTAILQRQPPTTTNREEHPSAERPSNEERDSPTELEDAQIALVQHFLVEMGYSLFRQRTLQYNELGALEQHELALRILAEVVVDDVEERQRHERRLREEGSHAEEECCTLREYEAGVACEMCLRWGEQIWGV